MHFTETEIEKIISDKIVGLTHKKIASPDEELVESGILTSITIAELAVEVEKLFSVSVLFMDVSKENFTSVNTIKKLVQKKLI